MKVLFTQLPLLPEYDTASMRWAPPLAVYYLSTILRDAGIEVDIIDPQYFRDSTYFLGDKEAEKIVSCIIKQDYYDAILISVTTLTWGVTKKFIEQIKRISNIKVIVGGIHASYFSEYILNSTNTDFVISGEGEKILVDLLDCLNSTEKYEHIRGISYKQNGNVIANKANRNLSITDLMSYYYIDYNYVPDKTYDVFGIETSRGCKFNCMFCSVYYKCNWRGWTCDKASDRIKDHYDTIKRKSKSGHPIIYFVDDCFTADVARASSILNCLHTKIPDIKVSFETRATDLINSNLIEEIPLEMIDVFQIGVEAGYNEGLQKIRKAVTVEQIEQCIQMLSDYNLEKHASLSFIIGFPWETIDDAKKTINTAIYLSSTYGVLTDVHWLYLMPSDLWYSREKYGINVNEKIFDNPAWHVDQNIFLKTHPNFGTKEIEEINEIMGKYSKYFF